MDNVAERLMVVKGDGIVRIFEGAYGEVRIARPMEDGATVAHSPGQACLLWSVLTRREGRGCFHWHRGRL